MGEPRGLRVPDWIELLPVGYFTGKDNRGPYCVADPAAVVRASIANAPGSGLPIDYDHATDYAAPEGRPAPAAGWIKELKVRAGAIWGKVMWTSAAARAIALGEYRHVSPVFAHEPGGRVKRLLRAGLTNNPNLDLIAICSRGGTQVMNDVERQIWSAFKLDEGKFPSAARSDRQTTLQARGIRNRTDQAGKGRLDELTESIQSDAEEIGIPPDHLVELIRQEIDRRGGENETEEEMTERHKRELEECRMRRGAHGRRPTSAHSSFSGGYGRAEAERMVSDFFHLDPVQLKRHRNR